jgi:hypothetical protein
MNRNTPLRLPYPFVLAAATTVFFAGVAPSARASCQQRHYRRDVFRRRLRSRDGRIGRTNPMVQSQNFASSGANGVVDGI